MKWSEPSNTGQVSLDPPGYTISMGKDGTLAVFEAWFNAGTSGAPKPVFLGQVRVETHYDQGRKEAAREVRAACEKHAQAVIDSALRTTSNS